MRNLNRAGLAILVVLSLPTHAALAQKQNLMSGAFVSGSTLYKSCAGSIAGDREYCLGYVLGVSDAMELAIASGTPIGGWDACMPTGPTGATAAQARDVVKNYLAAHPERRRSSAASQTIIALAEAYPCKP